MIVNEILKIIDEDFNNVLNEYKDASCVLNKKVEFRYKGQIYNGIAKDINNLGNLIVKCDNQEYTLNSGEVSIIQKIMNNTLKMTYCGIFTALIAIGAFIQIPLPYMDYFTLQFLFVLLSGILLGSKLGGLAVLIYVLIGLIGIPIFASGGGIGIF